MLSREDCNHVTGNTTRDQGTGQIILEGYSSLVAIMVVGVLHEQKTVNRKHEKQKFKPHSENKSLNTFIL